MGTSVLIDTNILIYVFSQTLSPDLARKLSIYFRDSFVISAINKIEFLGWKAATEEEYKQAVKFLTHAQVIGIDKRVIEKTIELKRQKNIKLPDGVIAATCLVHRLTLLTQNEHDFNQIEGLTVFNPFA